MPWLPTLAGAAVWTTGVVILDPSPFETGWARAILLLAALVLVPLALRLVSPTEASRLTTYGLAARILQLPAAVLFAAAQLLSPGLLAACLTIPWLLTTALIALVGIGRLGRHRCLPLHEICIGAGLAYLGVGGAWALLDRLGLQPLDFEPVIVLLTAIHFHYAGFLLPLLTGLAMREVVGRTSIHAGIGVIAGVPLVAVGITATQLGLGPHLEAASAFILAGAGFLTAWLYLRLALTAGYPPLARALWSVAALCLAGSMTLAVVYAARFYLPVCALDIPWMRALHGTANALGFGLLGLLGWVVARRRAP
jgi:hypothetical protein